MATSISDSIRPHLPLGDDHAALIDRLIPVRTFPKGSVLLEEGHVARACYFVLSGLVRAFRVVEGEERTVGFHPEGTNIAPLASYLNGTPADHWLACLEPSTLAVLTREAEQELERSVPGFGTLCRLGMEQDFARQQARLADLLTSTPEDRYRTLQREHPDLLDRVPQYVLASYLGVRPESLSRIRGRIARKR